VRGDDMREERVKLARQTLLAVTPVQNQT
jgi:hypothetical protein